MSALVIAPRARLFHGHVWVYATEIKARLGDPKPGDVVSLLDARSKHLGSAIYNPHSQISARLFSYRRQDLDADFFRRRVQRAMNLRQQAGVDLKLCRLINSEGDGLPGVIVDAYGDCLVLQTLTLAMDQRKGLLVEALRELLAPRCIVERNDSNRRRSEGMEPVKGLLWGELPTELEVSHRGSVFGVDLLDGQKTGLYLDQLENYQRVASLAKGRRVLDCFCNQGGFAQACALAGAASVTAVDVSEDAIARARINAQKSGAAVEFAAANCFDDLKAREVAGQRFDLIILDPPSFTKSKAALKDALRGYKEIHLRALKMLEPGGILATFSCSHHVSRGEFHASLEDAAVDVRRTLRRLAVYGQSLDHPVIATIPESEYLVGYAYEVLASW